MPPSVVKLLKALVTKVAPAPLVETLLRLKPETVEPGETSVKLLLAPPV